MNVRLKMKCILIIHILVCTCVFVRPYYQHRRQMRREGEKSAASNAGQEPCRHSRHRPGRTSERALPFLRKLSPDAVGITGLFFQPLASVLNVENAELCHFRNFYGGIVFICNTSFCRNALLIQIAEISRESSRNYTIVG